MGADIQGFPSHISYKTRGILIGLIKPHNTTKGTAVTPSLIVIK